MRITPETTSTTGETIVFDHINGTVHLGDYSLPYKPEPDPPGPLCRAQNWLWKRKGEGSRRLGNLISDVRYVLWLICR